VLYDHLEVGILVEEMSLIFIRKGDKMSEGYLSPSNTSLL
jgi:hypothetical protein